MYAPFREFPPSLFPPQARWLQSSQLPCRVIPPLSPVAAVLPITLPCDPPLSARWLQYSQLPCHVIPPPPSQPGGCSTPNYPAM